MWTRANPPLLTRMVVAEKDALSRDEVCGSEVSVSLALARGSTCDREHLPSAVGTFGRIARLVSTEALEDEEFYRPGPVLAMCGIGERHMINASVDRRVVIG